MKQYTKIIDYLLIVILILISGNPIIKFDPIYIVLTITFLIFTSFSSYSFLKKQLVLYILLYLFIFSLQYIVFKWNSIPAIVNRVAIIISGVYILYKIGPKFRYYYFYVMYLFSLISLIFFGFTILNGEALNLFGDMKRYYSVGIYNHVYYLGELIYRNSGPFWEPGAFAGYLILVPLLFINNITDLWKRNKYKLIILFLTLLTTQSTTGFIALFLILGYILYKKTKYVILKITIIPFVLFFSYFAYNNIDFLGDKIETQYYRSVVKVESGNFSADRIGSLFFDWHYIKKNPIIGNGLHSKTRYADHPWLINQSIGHGNGFSHFIACHGLIIAFIYFFLVFRNLPFKLNDKLIFLLIIIILLQGEQFLNYPLFNALPFLFHRKN